MSVATSNSSLTKKSVEFLDEQNKISSNVKKFIEIIKQFKSISNSLVEYELFKQNRVIEALDKKSDISTTSDIKNIDDIHGYFSNILVPLNIALASIFLKLTNQQVDMEKLRFDGNHFLEYFKQIPVMIRMTLNAKLSYYIQMVKFNNLTKQEILKKSELHHLFQKSLALHNVHYNLCKVAKNVKLTLSIDISNLDQLSKSQEIYKILGSNLASPLNYMMENNFQQRDKEFDFFKKMKEKINKTNYTTINKQVLDINIDNFETNEKNLFGFNLFDDDISCLPADRNRNRINLLKLATSSPYCTNNNMLGLGGADITSNLATLFSNSAGLLHDKDAVSFKYNKGPSTELLPIIKRGPKKRRTDSLRGKKPSSNFFEDSPKDVESLKQNIEKLYFQLLTDPAEFSLTENDDYNKIKSVYGTLANVSEELLNYNEKLLHSADMNTVTMDESEIFDELKNFSSESEEKLNKVINMRQYDDKIVFEMLSIIPLQLHLFQKIKIILSALSKNLRYLVEITNNLTVYLQVKMGLERLTMNSLHENSYVVTTFVPKKVLEHMMPLLKTDISSINMIKMMEACKANNNYIVVNGTQITPIEYFALNNVDHNNNQELCSKIVKNHIAVFDAACSMIKKTLYHILHPAPPDMVYNTVQYYADTVSDKLKTTMNEESKTNIIETPWKSSYEESNFLEGLSSFHVNNKVNGYLTKLVTHMLEPIFFLNIDTPQAVSILDYYAENFCPLLAFNFKRFLFIRIVMNASLQLVSSPTASTLSFKLTDEELHNIFSKYNMADDLKYSNNGFIIEKKKDAYIVKCRDLEQPSQADDITLVPNQEVFDCIDALIRNPDEESASKLDEIFTTGRLLKLDNQIDDQNNVHIFQPSINIKPEPYNTLGAVASNLFEKGLILKSLEKVTRRIVSCKKIINSSTPSYQCTKSFYLPCNAMEFVIEKS